MKSLLENVNETDEKLWEFKRPIMNGNDVPILREGIISVVE